MVILDRRPTAILVISCAVVAAAAAAVPATGGYQYGGFHDRSLYDVSTVLQLSLLLVAGVLLLRADPLVARIASILTIVAGAQIAGTGSVAVRRWRTSGGFSTRADNQQLLRILAVVIALCGLVAVATAVLALWHAHGFRPVRRARILVVTATLAAGLLVVAVPVAMGHEFGDRLSQGAAHVLMYALPWAFALVVAALVDRMAAITAALAVAVSAAPLLDEVAMIPGSRPAGGFVVAIIAAAMVVAGALATSAEPRESSRGSAAG